MPNVRANAALIGGLFNATLALALSFGLKLSVGELGALQAFFATAIGVAVHWSAVDDVRAGRRNGATVSRALIKPDLPQPPPVNPVDRPGPA
jgi:hypothetical protein